MKMKKRYFVPGFLFLLLGLTSCGLLEKSTTTVRFTLPAAALGSVSGGPDEASGAARSLDAGGANLLYVMDLMDNGRTFRFPVTDRNMELILDKDGVYLFSLLNVPEVGGTNGTTTTGSIRSVSPRDISGAVSTLGSLRIILSDPLLTGGAESFSGLDSLPLGMAAADEVELGALTAGESTYNSELTLQEVLGSTGLPSEALARISDADVKNHGFKNPDIDGNGILDEDEGIEWRFFQRITTFMGFDYYDFDTGVMNRDFSSLGQEVWLQFEGSFLEENITGVNLIVPESINLLLNGESATEVEGWEGWLWFLVQDHNNDDQVVSTPPYNGDFILRVPGTPETDYPINNVVFNDNTYDFD